MNCSGAAIKKGTLINLADYCALLRAITQLLLACPHWRMIQKGHMRALIRMPLFRAKRHLGRVRNKAGGASSRKSRTVAVSLPRQNGIKRCRRPRLPVHRHRWRLRPSAPRRHIHCPDKCVETIIKPKFYIALERTNTDKDVNLLIRTRRLQRCKPV